MIEIGFVEFCEVKKAKFLFKLDIENRREWKSC